MKQAKISLAVATLVAAAFGMASAGAGNIPSARDCDPVAQTTVSHLYRYCGNHWAHYPIHFSVDTSVRPAGLDAATFQTKFIEAAKAAASAWNAGWPDQRPGSCGVQVVLCYDEAATSTKVVFASLPSAVIGQTTPSSGAIITSAVIKLNSGLSWKFVAKDDYAALAMGELVGDTQVRSLCAGCPYDVQNVLTHEFGHLLGLEHPGTNTNSPGCGSDVLETADLQQTMYGCIPPGDTSKRTLAEGDMLGLEQIFNDSM